MVYDVVIIGAGVTGCFIARELSRYRLKICVLEKESDVAVVTSSANSGIIHAGYDAQPGSLKALLNVQGSAMMESVCTQLDIPCRRTGSLVIAFDEKDMENVLALKKRGHVNGIERLSLLEGRQAREMEPNISEDVTGALYAPDAAIVSPFEMTIAAAENAVVNGTQIKLEHEVTGIEPEGSILRVITSEGGISAQYVVNAAGLHADEIAMMAGDNSFDIQPRKGEYLLFDKKVGGTVRSIVFQTPTAMGKGILVAPTVEGNLLIGPNANDTGNRNDFETTSQGLDEVIKGARKSVPNINTGEVITAFAGLRAVPSTGDFIIGPSKSVQGMLHVAGIESPGLSSAPAIAVYAVNQLGEMGLSLERKTGFVSTRKSIRRFKDMDEDEKRKAIEKNPLYGNIVCRCESVSEAEVIEAIHRPEGTQARNLDAVKRRTRAGMGRCQGGFCMPKLIDILSRELGIPKDKITKSGGNSWILAGKTPKGGMHNEKH